MLSLADFLVANGIGATFAIRRMDGDLCAYIAERGHAVAIVGKTDPADPTWLGVSPEREIEETTALVGRLPRRPRWIVVDHYAIDARWERAMRDLAIRVLAIDDLGRSHASDYVLDATLGSPMRYAKTANGDERVLFGPRFAFVRESFVAARSVARTRDGSISRILVFYGGVDASGETLKAVRALRSIAASVTVDIVCGGRSAWRAAVEAAATPDTRLRVWGNREDMADLMVSADLALGAGGTATWERCYVGLPTIATSIAPNQDAVVAELAAAGALVSLGRARDVGERDVADRIEQLLSDPVSVRRIAARAADVVQGWEEARSELLLIFHS